MINLLPPDDKKQLAAARTNTLLARYSVLLSIIVVFLALEVVGMYLVVDASTAQNESIIAENEQKTAAYASTKQQAAVFSSNLATAKYILGKQAPYTRLIFALSTSLPEGSVLDTMALDPTTFGTPTTLTVKTQSYNKAVEVKAALQNAKINGKTPLFTSVSFQSLSASEELTSQYRFTAILNVTYSKEALSS